MFKRNQNKGKIVYFYLALFYCLIVHGYSMEERVSFADAFTGRHPFYAISVARETTDDAHYPKLQPDEENLVFIFLENLLNGNPEIIADFQQKDMQILQNEQKVFYKILEFYYQSLQETIKEAIQQAKLRAERIRKEVRLSPQAIESKMQQKLKESFSEEEVILFYYLLAQIKYPGCPEIEFLTSTKHEQLIKECAEERFSASVVNDTIKTFFEVKHSKKVEQYSESIRMLEFFARTKESTYFLIAFNEMFFGKAKDDLEQYAPLSLEEFERISNRLKKISSEHLKTIICANFLHFNHDKILGVDYKQSLLATAQLLNEYSFEERETSKFEERRFSFFDSESLCGLLPDIKDEIEYSTFINQSLMYWAGEPFARYQKLSYKDEANSLLSNNQNVYALGTGNDEPLPSTSPNNLLNYISTSTCYDLQIGVRYKLKTYPRTGKVHIVLSNTLPFSPELSRSGGSFEDKFFYLPDNIPLIFHIDPHEQNIFSKKKGISLFDNYRQRYLTRQTGDNDIHFYDLFEESKRTQLVKNTPLYTFRFGFKNNFFTFKIWDLQKLLADETSRNEFNH